MQRLLVVPWSRAAAYLATEPSPLYLHEQGPVERSGGAADTRHESHADRLQRRPDVVALEPIQPLERLPHPPVHVGSVIAVADRRVEIGQLGPVLGHLGAEA